MSPPERATAPDSEAGGGGQDQQAKRIGAQDSTHATVGASLEVIRHHGRLHDEKCPGEPSPGRVVICPCEGCAVIVCGRCGDIVFVCIAPHRDPCVHALELLEGGGS